MTQRSRAVRHIWRQRPSAVRMASQTLLSSRTRTREIEDFFFGQTAFSGQAVKRGQQAIQFARFGKKILIKAHRFLVGQLPDSLNHASRDHALNLFLPVPQASAKRCRAKRCREHPDGRMKWVGGQPTDSPPRAACAAIDFKNRAAELQ